MPGNGIEKASTSQLISAVEETESYAFLIGAGTSKPEPAGIPTGGELIYKWRKECYNRQNPEKDFEKWVKNKEEGISKNKEYGFWFEERHPTSGERRERIRDLVEDATPTPGHIILACLMSDEGDQNYVPHTLTPNFDDLLFDAFYLYLDDKPQVVDHRAVAPEFKLTRNRPAIVKLHGDYLYNNLQNTEEETRALAPGLEEVLKQTIREYGLVVVGYSGTDKSIMEPLLDADISEYGIYWCTRNPEKLSDKAKRLLNRKNSYVVPYKGFDSLMMKFGREIDDIQPPMREELFNRAEKRADMLEGILEERQEAADDEEEDYIRKWNRVSNAKEKARNGNLEEAISIFDQVLDQDPEFVEAYNSRGTAKADLGELEAAVEDYDQALEIDPELPIAYYNRGIAHSEMGELEAAVEDYDQALEIDPESPMIYNNRGRVKGRLGEYEAAIEDYNEALNLDHEKIHTLQNRAEAKILAGNFEGALEDASKAHKESRTIVECTVSLLLLLVTRIVLEDEVDEKEREYRNLCKQESGTYWDLDELNMWLENVDLNAAKKDRIQDLMDLLPEEKTDLKREVAS